MEWRIGGHGRPDLRSLLIEAAHSILRSSKTDLAKWGKKLLARKGQIKLVIAAIARKLTVAVWYLLIGRWTPLEEIDERLEIKMTKMIGQVGPKGLEKLGKTRQSFRQEIEQRFKTGRVYVLDPNPRMLSQIRSEVPRAECHRRSSATLNRKKQ